MNYLSKDDLLDLHTFIVTRYGGRLGIASHDRLVSVLDAPRQVMFGAELYPDLSGKAAALAFLLLKSRPFVSGNEGTALLALLRFLEINGAGVQDDAGVDELGRLIRGVNRSEIDKLEFEERLRDLIDEPPG